MIGRRVVTRDCPQGLCDGRHVIARAMAVDFTLRSRRGPGGDGRGPHFKLKVRARGFRSKRRFRNAIYFHLGGLELCPASVKPAFSPT